MRGGHDAGAHDGAPVSGLAVPVLHTSAAALQFGADGSVRLQPQETGPLALVMLVLAALFEGQQVGTGRRLKTCRNPRCRVAFYDRSRNASGVWHSVRVCGNAINLAPTASAGALRTNPDQMVCKVGE